jgi:uncharacterized glyoxalase superfamily protein PhnB
MAESAILRGIHIFARDVPASVAFYQRAGLEFSSTSHDFARADGDRAALEIGSHKLTRGYDPAFKEPPGGGGTALQIGVASREAVDQVFANLTAAGYEPHLAPIDAFWGSRYAEVHDPDGNLVGFQSPRDDTKVTRPPL